MTKRRCTARTKKGKACRAWALDGHLVCMAHAGKEVQESAGFGGSQPGAGRPRKVKPMEIEKQLLEENAVAWMNPYWQALGFELVITDDGPKLQELEDGGAMIYGESKDGDINMTSHPDLGARINAAEKLRDRVFGRPRQTTEITGPGGGKIEVDVASSAVEDARAAFLASFPNGVAGVDPAAMLPAGSNN